MNIWIGDGRSVTSIHSDPYENIYTVLRGQKSFTLLPPSDSLHLKGTRPWRCTLTIERMYPHATYTRPVSSLEITPTDSTVRWSSISDPDVDVPGAHPIHITLEAGDSLYLPAGWWHHVRQKDVTISINWWYDAEMRGMSWVWMGLLRPNVDN